MQLFREVTNPADLPSNLIIILSVSGKHLTEMLCGKKTSIPSLRWRHQPRAQAPSPRFDRPCGAVLLCCTRQARARCGGREGDRIGGGLGVKGGGGGEGRFRWGFRSVLSSVCPPSFQSRSAAPFRPRETATESSLSGNFHQRISVTYRAKVARRRYGSSNCQFTFRLSHFIPDSFRLFLHCYSPPLLCLL